MSFKYAGVNFTNADAGFLGASVLIDMMIKEIKTELFADYFQFYIQDEKVDGNLSGS